MAVHFWVAVCDEGFSGMGCSGISSASGCALVKSVIFYWKVVMRRFLLASPTYSVRCGSLHY